VTAVENIKKADENTQTAKPKSIEEFTAMDNQGGDLYKNENIVPGTEELPDAPRPSVNFFECLRLFKISCLGCGTFSISGQSCCAKCWFTSPDCHQQDIEFPRRYNSGHIG
jgi:hypothetical protein